MIVDTHLHLIDKTALRYPWLAGVPALDHDFSQEEYAAQARRAGIEAALFMEVDVDAADIEAELAYVEGLAKAPGSLLRGAIVACRPEEAGFAAWLEKVQASSFAKGFRRVLHVVPDDVSERPLFRENIRRIAGTGLTFDLCVLPGQMRQAFALVDSAPDVQFVLDHCGVPDIKGKAEHPWKEQIAELAKRPNVVGKISGVVAYATPRRGPSRRCGPMSGTPLPASAGIASCGAATGRSARWAAACSTGLRRRTPCLPVPATRSAPSFCPATQNGSGSCKRMPAGQANPYAPKLFRNSRLRSATTSPAA